VAETEALIAQVLREFARVLKPGGECLIFEMSPAFPFGGMERLMWNPLKRILGAPLDMFFWPITNLRQLAAAAAPAARFAVQFFPSSAWTTFPPIFSLPWLRIPRFLYPLNPVAYHWRF
jgi:ubiquinone/menaquinone biosynthesis C-methylase UbiE